MSVKIAKEKIIKKSEIEKEPQAINLKKRIIKSIISIFRSPYTRLLILIICLVTAILCLKSTYRLNERLDKLHEHITTEAAENTTNLALIEKRLFGRMALTDEIVLAALAGLSFEGNIWTIHSSDINEESQMAFHNLDTNEESLSAIRNLETNILSLLDAQRRRTMESFYREDVLTVERREAEDAFNTGRYVTAHQLYSEIATAYPDDQDARFYQYYSLFLINKMDRSNYRIIRDVMTLLERHGYSRRELTEILAFIAEETRMNGETNP